MTPDCQACRNSYDGADDRLRCRISGLQAKPANAAGCKRFEPKPADVSSPAHRVWYCDAPGRGD